MSGDDFVTDTLLEDFLSIHLGSRCNDSSVVDARVPPLENENSKKPEETVTVEGLEAERDNLIALAGAHKRKMEALQKVLKDQKDEEPFVREGRRKFKELNEVYDEISALMNIEEEKNEELLRRVKLESRRERVKKEAAYKEKVDAEKRNIRNLRAETKSLDKRRYKILMRFVELYELHKNNGRFNHKQEQLYLQCKQEFEEKMKKDDSSSLDESK